MTFPLPEGLPAGRLVPDGSPVMWQSDEPPADPLAEWTRYQRQQGDTGLMPVLCYPNRRSDSPDLAAVDAVDLEGDLEEGWRGYPKHRLAGDGPGARFDRWPGLARGTLASCGVDPDEAARSAFALLADEWPYELWDGCLGLVAARRSADIPALVGWRAEAPLPVLCALLRSWEDRFGARVLAAVGSTLYVSVASPPRDEQQAQHVALEHLLTTADNIVDDPPTPFPEYAASLVDAPLWRFWWD
ncbi:DUF4253 domain-containing protein [Streptomyces sp. NPDC050564]|uniref:DUF4253 domain-containing protein n=1 Tax=Streptomyces sp. NPDC050564 TaxID=3365631 RepID=UPI003789F691